MEQNINKDPEKVERILVKGIWDIVGNVKAATLHEFR